MDVPEGEIVLKFSMSSILRGAEPGIGMDGVLVVGRGGFGGIVISNLNTLVCCPFLRCQ